MAAGRDKITVQVVVDGEVVKQASTSANFGLAQVSWSPSEERHPHEEADEKRRE